MLSPVPNAADQGTLLPSSRSCVASEISEVVSAPWALSMAVSLNQKCPSRMPRPGDMFHILPCFFIVFHTFFTFRIFQLLERKKIQEL